MKESQIQTLFSKQNTVYGCFELKLCKGTSIRFDAVRPHQLQALLDVSSNKGLFHKINDMPIFSGDLSRFTNPKPFDCFYLKNIPAYIIVCFYIPRVQKTCYYLSPSSWQLLEITSPKKSIREEELKKYAYHILELKNKIT